MKFLIKLSPEITIKSKPVRKRAIMMLKNNITKHLEYNGLKVFLGGNWDAINLEYNKKIDSPEEREIITKRIKNILKGVTGIAHFMEVASFTIKECTSKDDIFQKIFNETKKIHLHTIEGKSFVVRIKRTGIHGFTSTEIERYIGGGMLKYSERSSVSLKQPDVTIRIEIKNTTFHIIKQQILGTNGYPIGFQDKVISLISGGFDSGVSTYSMMKRGCRVDYLFFNLGGSAHELGVKQVSHYLWKTFSIPHSKARFISINFEDIMQELLENVHHKLRGIILKRLMLQIASRIAENNYYALVKGDSLGQVSSQTLRNMHVIDKASDALVFRPLIGHNKQEIVDISQKIGTYHFACNMPEYCGTISDKPSTGASLEDILEEENNLTEDILEKAFKDRKIEFVKDIPKNNSFSGEHTIERVDSVKKDEIVVDVREVEKIKKKPLKMSSDILEIPFFHINSQFSKLDQKKMYLFYCDKGILSELHGLYLKEKGFSNIKVFRPKK